MNSKIQAKIDEIKKQSEQTKGERKLPARVSSSKADSLSLAIRTKKDADAFMAEIDAIRKKRD